MNEDNQKIAIAEACGWTKCRLAIKGAGAPERGKSPYGVPPRRGYEVSLPNYTQDLNAMHEAEKVLTYEQAEEFVEQLYLADQKNNLAENPPPWRFNVASATAAQRAEAFLRTIGKWEGAK